MSRARANWRRVAIMRNKMQRLVAAFRYVQSWRKPYVSLAAMLTLTTLSFHPHIVISLVLLSLAIYAWVNFDPESGKPLSMEADPEAEEDNEEVHSAAPKTCVALSMMIPIAQAARPDNCYQVLPAGHSPNARQSAYARWS